MKIPRAYKANKVLLADDEPEHLEWLVDFLRAKGLDVEIATTVRDAIDRMEQESHRLYLIDLNIPFGGWTPTFRKVSSTYSDYPGLHMLKFVRSQGNSGKRVLAYSAHKNDALTSEIKNLYCQYVVKGRPAELKNALEGVLEADPYANRKRPKPRAKVAAVGEKGRTKAKSSSRSKKLKARGGRKSRK